MNNQVALLGWNLKCEFLQREENWRTQRKTWWLEKTPLHHPCVIPAPLAAMIKETLKPWALTINLISIKLVSLKLSNQWANTGYLNINQNHTRKILQLIRFWVGIVIPSTPDTSIHPMATSSKAVTCTCLCCNISFHIQCLLDVCSFLSPPGPWSKMNKECRRMCYIHWKMTFPVGTEHRTLLYQVLMVLNFHILVK